MAPVIDRAESSLDRVSVEGRRSVRRKAAELRVKLTETRNRAFATVGLIKSKGDEAGKEKALKRYEVLYQELVEALGTYEKAARR